MSNKRIFISFAIEDSNLRDMLVGQSNNNNAPFSFVDMSVKQAWDSSWKTKCRTKIKGCHGMIVIFTKKTRNADGQLWEVKCARDEGIPIRVIYGYINDKPKLVPSELDGLRTVNWTWPNISNWLKTL